MPETSEQDYPLIRQQARCPTCGHHKGRDMLFCWPCHRGGKDIPNFGKLACEEMEASLAAKIAPAKGRSASRVIDIIEYCDPANPAATKRFPFPIEVQRISGSAAANNETFRVRYGFDVKHGTLEETCHDLGAAIMHALQCESEFE